MRINPDIVASLDVPCEPESLATLGISIDEAIALTIKNAEWIIKRVQFDKTSFNLKKYVEEKDPRLDGRKIAIGIQGWAVDDYIRCLHKYWDLGFGELPPDKFMFAIGTICRRDPLTVYAIAQELRDRIPSEFDMHCYGISQINCVTQLRQIGITSCDSSTASVASAFYRFLDRGGLQARLFLETKDTLMQNALFAFNIASLNYQIENVNFPVLEQLFFDESKQLDLG
jgi:hypothetical protein